MNLHLKLISRSEGKPGYKPNRIGIIHNEMNAGKAKNSLPNSMLI